MVYFSSFLDWSPSNVGAGRPRREGERKPFSPSSIFPMLKVQLSKARSKRRNNVCDPMVTGRSKMKEEKSPNTIRPISQAETPESPDSEFSPMSSRHHRRMSLKRLWCKQPSPVDREPGIDEDFGPELSYILGIEGSGSVHSVDAKRYPRMCKNPEKRKSREAEVIDPFMRVQHGSLEDTPSFFSQDAMKSRTSVSSGVASGQQSPYIY